MTRSTTRASRVALPAFALAAALGVAPAVAGGGGGNMNPAGSSTQPDPQETGRSSGGTGEASRASSADTAAEKKELPGGAKTMHDPKDKMDGSEKTSQ